MIQFVIAQYGSSDFRLMKYDGNQTIIQEYTSKPALKNCVNGIMDFHGTGDSPFSSRDAAIDAFILCNEWPVSTCDMSITGEKLPWHDEL